MGPSLSSRHAPRASLNAAVQSGGRVRPPPPAALLRRTTTGPHTRQVRKRLRFRGPGRPGGVWASSGPHMATRRTSCRTGHGEPPGSPGPRTNRGAAPLGERPPALGTATAVARVPVASAFCLRPKRSAPARPPFHPSPAPAPSRYLPSVPSPRRPSAVGQDSSVARII